MRAQWWWRAAQIEFMRDGSLSTRGWWLFDPWFLFSSPRSKHIYHVGTCAHVISPPPILGRYISIIYTVCLVFIAWIIILSWNRLRSVVLRLAYFIGSWQSMILLIDDALQVEWIDDRNQVVCFCCWSRLREYGVCNMAAQLANQLNKRCGLSSELCTTRHFQSRLPPYTKLYSLRFDCKIVSFTAANTNRMFSVSVAHVKCE